MAAPPRAPAKRIAVLFAALVIACVAPPQPPVYELPAPVPNRQWVRCDDVETEASTTRTITGGQATTLTLPRGHVLEVPAGALAGGTQITVTFRQLSSPGAVVELRPDNQAFRQQLTLTISLRGRNCDVPAGSSLQIHRIRADGAHEPLPRPPGTPPGEARGLLDRFSTFAIAR